MTASRRHSPIEQWARLAVQAQPHVHGTESIHQRGLDRGLLRKLAINPGRALIQHLTRRYRVAARLAWVGDLEQIHHEFRGLLRRLRLRLRPRRLSLGGGALYQGIGGQAAGHHHASHRRAGHGEQSAVAPLCLAASQRVVADAEHPGDHFQLRRLLAVLSRASIGGDRLRPDIAQLAIGSEPEAQRRGKHSSSALPGRSVALGSPPTIRQKIRSSPPRRL